MATYHPNIPVPTDRWDSNTVNPQLPHHNDVWPQLTPPVNIDQQMMYAGVVQFRTFAQNRLNRTPLHIVFYNLLAANYFNNSLFPHWCQRVVDFTEYLVVCQNETLDNAVSKAVTRMYMTGLAFVLSDYNDLATYLSQPEITELQNWLTEFAALEQDLRAFHQGGRRPMTQPTMHPQMWGSQPQPYAQQGSRQLPPVGMGAPHQRAPVSMSVPSGPAPYIPPAQSGGSGRYLDDVVKTTDIPKTSQGFWTTADEPKPTPVSSMSETVPVSIQEDPSLPVPRDLDEVVIKPGYYTPQGITTDPKRPYDQLFNPGGVEIKPAHLSGWTRSRSDTTPYSMSYDPTQFVLFHVKWPDGVVQEKIIPWGSDMDYLKHEIDSELRSFKIDPDAQGKVVYNKHKIIDIDESAVTAGHAAEYLDHWLDVESELAPVILDNAFGSSTDMENERDARRVLLNRLGLDEDVERIPAYEYVSAFVYPMEIDEYASQRLNDLEHTPLLVNIGSVLRAMLADGSLPVRYYRFLNDRLTKGMNSVLADNLSMSNLSIDNFVDDVEALVKHVYEHFGTEEVELLDKNAGNLAKRWLSVGTAEVINDEPMKAVVMDQYVNLQTSWEYSEIASVNLTKEPVLISEGTHPKFHRVVKDLVERCKERDQLKTHTVRLITTDGVYLKVISGWLVKDALLIKKV